MEHDELEVVGQTRPWNRRILNAYWMVLLLSGVIESLNLFFTLRDAKDFILHYILLPTGLLMAVTLSTEVVYLKSKKYADYFMIVSATIMASVLIAVHSSLYVIWAALFLPLLVSIFYFSKRKLMFAFFTSLLAFALLCLCNSYIKAHMTLMDMFTMVAVLMVATVTAQGVMQRGIEIAENLKKTFAAQRELLVKNALMEKLAKTDALTGLNNHMSYHEYLYELIKQSESYHISLHLAVLDIDNFKKVNDTYGHRVGDQVLEFVGNQIRAMIRVDDFVARYGGEEFVLIFVECTSEEVLRCVERIRTEIARVHHAELEDRPVTVSIGVNRYEPGMGKEALFEGADDALYEAKRTGKNRCVMHERAMEFI